MQPYMFEHFGNPSSIHVYGQQVRLLTIKSCDSSLHGVVVASLSNASHSRLSSRSRAMLMTGAATATLLHSDSFLW